MKYYDLIIGANGQDGKILSHILSEKNTNVVLVSRNFNFIAPCLQIMKTINLMNFDDVQNVLNSFRFRHVYYFAATHTTQKKFINLDDYEARCINYEVPKFIIEFLTEKNNITSFIYASSKLVFKADRQNYSFDKPRNYNNPYAKWKNQFEHYVDTKCFKLKLLLIVWFSNHDSEYRNEQFLLPRLAKRLCEHILNSKKQFDEEFKIFNDWGDAWEFMNIVNEFVEGKVSIRSHKQFLSNNDVVDLDEVISEILYHGTNYQNYIDKTDSNLNEKYFFSESDFLRKPIISTRQTIWNMVEHQFRSKIYENF